MQITPLLGANGSELGNIILGYNAAAIHITDNISLTETINGSVRQTFDAILGQNETRLGRVLLGHIPVYPFTQVDTLTLTQSITQSGAKNFLQTLILTETITPLRIHHESLTDTLVLTETLNHHSSSYTFVDTLTFVEHASGITGSYINQTINQSLSLSETVRLDVGGNQAVFDELDLEDTITIKGVYKKSIVDTLTLTQTFTHQRIVNQYKSDTLTLAEILTHKRIVVRKIVDHLHLTETIHKNAVYGRTIHDTIKFLDPIPLVINYYTTVNVPAVQVIVLEPDAARLCCQI